MSFHQYTPIKSLRKAKDRARFTQDLTLHVLRTDLAVIEERMTETSRELLFGFIGEHISASIWLRPDETDWIISWYGAKRSIAPLPGVWESVNQHHRHKATSFPRSLDDVIRRLVDGFTAAKDGTAFLE